MRRLLVGVMLTFLSVPLFAGDGWRDGDRYDGYRDRYRDDSYNRGGGWDGRREYSNSPVERSLQDLQRIAARDFMSGRDRDRVSNAMRDLQEFQYRYRQGRFDNGRLDHAIDNMKHLANGRDIHPRDRDIVARNINELRIFRSTGGRRY